VALSVSLTGFFIIISRAEALSQVIGYLILENGIYLFGIALLLEQPLLVELGMLLDVFVGIFVMGITVFHISREFEHTDTSRLSGLADWLPEVKRSE
jgi:hydrogenase-4 component E